MRSVYRRDSTKSTYKHSSGIFSNISDTDCFQNFFSNNRAFNPYPANTESDYPVTRLYTVG